MHGCLSAAIIMFLETDSFPQASLWENYCLHSRPQSVHGRQFEVPIFSPNKGYCTFSVF